MTNIEKREAMIAEQLVARGIFDLSVLRAMAEVPREEFVELNNAIDVYADCPLPIGQGQTISQPYIVALMIQLLEVKQQDRVLEVGAGCGYASAVLGRIAKEVYAIEWHKILAEQAKARITKLEMDNVYIQQGDGWLGLPDYAPYDGILVSAATEKVPKNLKAQLKIGARLIVPIGAQDKYQKLTRLTRISKEEYTKETICNVSFVPFLGSENSL